MPELIEIDERLELSVDKYGDYKAIENGTEAVNMDSYIPLRCFCSGFNYQTDPLTENKTTVWKHDTKFLRLDELIDECQGEQIIIAYNFVAEGDEIRARYNCRTIDGKSKAHQDAETIHLWNSGRLSILGVHPKSAGHGLNLQHSGACRIVWLSMPDSLESYLQTNGRLHRSGQTNTVFVHRMLCDKTIDRAIAGLIDRKELNQENLLKAMKRKDYK